MALADDILASHFTLTPVSGAIELVEVRGAEGWTSPNPHPALSLMRWTARDPQLAEEALAATVKRFEEPGRGFDWMTGPREREAGLNQLFEDHGFLTPPLKIAAMARTIEPAETFPSDDEVSVRKAREDEHEACFTVMAKGFDVPDEVGRVFHRAYLSPSPLQRTDVYVAPGDGGEVQGVGYLSYIGGGGSVLLRVSSVAEEHRGRGLYKALVNRRLEDASKAGRTQAFVHAYSARSQRALEELGFETAGELELYRWRP